MKISFDTTNLKHQIEEQPLIALGLATAALSGVAKVMNATAATRNSKAWRKEVNRRAQAQKRR